MYGKKHRYVRNYITARFAHCLCACCGAILEWIRIVVQCAQCLYADVRVSLLAILHR